MATYALKVNGVAVDLAASRVSLEEVSFSWRRGAELRFRQAVAHHQAEFQEEDQVELEVDGGVVFRGRIVERLLRGEPEREFVAYRAAGLREGARRVPVVDPTTGIPEVSFNSPPADEDNYQAGRARKTAGQIIQWLIDTFASDLIAAGVLVAGGTHYLQSELDALDVVPPEVVFSEVSVDEAIRMVLLYQPDHGYRIDPAAHTFRFERLSSLPEQTVTIEQSPAEDSDRVLANLLRPSTADCYTAYEIRGARKLTPAVFYLSRGELEELWDHTLEASWSLPRAFGEYERRDSGTDPIVQADTLIDLTKSWRTDEWADGFLVERIEETGGPRLLRAYRVLSNTATQVVVDGILLQAPSGATLTYELYAGVCPYRYVWSRYRIAEEDKRQVARQVPPVFQVANGFFLSHPLLERRLTMNGEEVWVPVSAQVFCDGSGVVLTATPLYTVPPGLSPLEPGQATGPEDVRLRCAYASGALVARYPETGYTGTAYTEAGLTRTRVRYLPEFVLEDDTDQYRSLAQQLLQPLKDINYSGEVSLAGLRWEFAGLGYRINVAARDRSGRPITTGFEQMAAGLAEVRYDFTRDRTVLAVATNVARTVYGAQSLEEARYRQWSARWGTPRSRYLQLRYALSVSIGHPTVNDGGARIGGDRSAEPPTTTSSLSPATTTSDTGGLTTTSSAGITSSSALTTSSSGPPPTTSWGTSNPPGTTSAPGSSEEPPPLTTTSSLPTTTTSGGTEIEHPCCPEGAPYRWGFSCGLFEAEPVDCTEMNGWSGELTWDPGSSQWVYEAANGWTVLLSCSVVEGYPRWELQLINTPCECSYISWENGGPEGTGPDCGVTCNGGTFDFDLCGGTGPPSCGSVTIWPI